MVNSLPTATQLVSEECAHLSSHGQRHVATWQPEEGQSPPSPAGPGHTKPVPFTRDQRPGTNWLSTCTHVIPSSLCVLLATRGERGWVTGTASVQGCVTSQSPEITAGAQS